MSVVIETTIGDITVDLYTIARPQTCRNFLKLCKVKYYNWHLFHTVQSGFIAQTGCPNGNGKGGESIYSMVLGEKARYYEAEKMPKIKHSRAGLLSMVNCGDNMLGSQFFITLAPELYSLDGEHCVFGEIVEGFDVISKFNETICDDDHRPYQDIRISHTVILEDPFDDPLGLIIPDRSPEPTKEALMSDRIGADEEIDDTAGMTLEEIQEFQKEKEAKARATILEIVGDIPDADMAPPENVLFVCKLNPITTDEDLEIIFSRFGKIVGCEIIRDRQTGESLQYAFIEFAERKSCEEAYFKMDNVLIDDRRIHVDFSQSVAKMRWKGKGKGIIHYNNTEKAANSDNNKKKRNMAQNKDSWKQSNDDRRHHREEHNYKKYDRRKENYIEDEREGIRGSKYSSYEMNKESRKGNDFYRRDDYNRMREKEKRSRDNRRRDRSKDRERKNERRESHSNRDFRTERKYKNNPNSDDEHEKSYRYKEQHSSSHKKKKNFDNGSSNSEDEKSHRNEEYYSSHKKKKISNKNDSDSEIDKSKKYEDHHSYKKKKSSDNHSSDDEVEKLHKHKDHHKYQKKRRSRDRSEDRYDRHSGSKRRK